MRVDLTKRQWFPLGVSRDGASFTTVNTQEGPLNLFIGHLVTTTNSDVSVTLIRDPDTGITYADVHNPTTSPDSVTLSVPVSTYLAAKQTQKVRVPAKSTVRLALSTADERLRVPADRFGHSTLVRLWFTRVARKVRLPDLIGRYLESLQTP